MENFSSNNSNILLGHCRKAHGLKGGFTFSLFNEENSVLENGSIITLLPEKSSSTLPQEGKTFTIKSIEFGNKVICYLEGICDRNQVDQLIPFKIYFDRNQFPAIDEDSDGYYMVDLIGLSVIDHKTKKPVGKILNSYDNGAQTIFVISLSIDSKLGSRIELPFIDDFFPVVNMDELQIEINLPTIIE